MIAKEPKKTMPPIPLHSGDCSNTPVDAECAMERSASEWIGSRPGVVPSKGGKAS